MPRYIQHLTYRAFDEYNTTYYLVCCSHKTRIKINKKVLKPRRCLEVLLVQPDKCIIKSCNSWIGMSPKTPDQCVATHLNQYEVIVNSD